MNETPRPMTEQEIASLAADAARFEDEFGCHVKGPLVTDDEDTSALGRRDWNVGSL